MATSGTFSTNAVYGANLIFNWSVQSQSIETNSTVIKWELKGRSVQTGYVISGAFKVTIAGSVVYRSSARRQLWTGTMVASGQFTLNHDNVGNCSFTAYAEAGIYYYAVSSTGSGTWSLPQIPRKAELTSAPNFTDLDNPKITYRNPLGGAATALEACISLTTALDDISYRSIPKTSTSYTFELTENERNILRQACTTSKSRTVYFYIRTVYNGVTYWSSIERTFTVVNADPTITQLSYADVKASTVEITQNNQRIIQNKSTLEIYVKAQPVKYATLSSISANINGVVTTVQGQAGQTDYTLAVGAVNVSSNIDANITVTDSRGYTETDKVALTILEYSEPTAEIELVRKHNYYDETYLTVKGRYSSLYSENTLTIRYRYKKKSEATYSQLVTIQNNTRETMTMDNRSEWDVEVYLTDRISSVPEYHLIVPMGLPQFYMDTKNKSIGINCIPPNKNSVWSQGIPIDDVIYIGSQQVFDTYEISPNDSNSAQLLQQLYPYNMFLFMGDLLHPSQSTPGYESAYRLSFLGSADSADLYCYIKFCNIESSRVTGTNDTYLQYRSIGTTRIFRETELDTIQGRPLSVHRTSYTSGLRGNCLFESITLHAYLVKTTTDLNAIGYNTWISYSPQ